MGSRMGRPKQFIDLLGKPALYHTLRAFEDAPGIERVYTVGDRGRIEALVAESGIRKYAGCAEPGESRSLSTKSGLRLCSEGDDTVLLIHDGSRCLVTPDLIERVVAAAREPGEASGVVAALPLSDTVKVAEEGIVTETLDRSRLWAMQTPQAFPLGLLREAHDGPEERLLSATDDASLVESAGGRVRLVQGEKTNIKLTSPEDLIFAEAILISRDGARNGEHGGYHLGLPHGLWWRSRS